MPELTKRYIVMAMATEAPFDVTDPEGVFVLKPWKDPAALRALQIYRDNCYPELARDLDAWIRAVEAGPTVRGGVGKRNEPHAKSVTPVPRPAAKPRVAAAPKSRAGKSPPKRKPAAKKR